MEEGETAVDQHGTKIGEVNKERVKEKLILLQLVGLEDKANSYQPTFWGDKTTWQLPVR